MRLTLFALSCPPPESPDGVRMDFGIAGGRIGRGSACTFVLRDPNRHISREHAEIRHRGGEFLLKVVSKVNSVIVNDTSVGPGEGVTLDAGDQITIGDYVLGVEIDAQSAAEPWAVASPAGDPFDLFAEPQGPSRAEPQQDTSPHWFRQPSPAELGPDEAQTRQADLDSIFRSFDQASPFADVLTSNRPAAPIPQPQVELSPISDGIESFLRSLDLPGETPASAPGIAHPELYRTGALSVPLHSVVAPPTAPVNLPIWDDDIFKALDDARGAAPPESRAPAAVEGDLQAEAEALPQPAPAAPGPSNAAPAAPAEGSDPAARLMAVLAEALGVEATDLDASRPEETVRVIGQLLRLATDGFFRLLEMRAQLKAELRIEDRTMIASRENNPLKHADNARDAVTYLVDVRQHGNRLFMPPTRAIEDTVADICAHEMAVMAGTRAALLSALKMFSPEVVEKRIQKTGALLNVVPALHKSRLWERFLTMYAELEQEAEQNFDRLLNAEFAKAYSEQNRLLRKRR